MSLADRLPEISVPQRSTCKTCLWLAAQPERDQQAFQQLNERTDLPKAFFHRVCVEEGLDASESSFKRHLENCCVSR